MIEVMDMGGTVLGFRASGKVSHEDYTDTLVPAVEKAVAANGSVSLYYELGSEFEGYTAHAMWDDSKLGMRFLTSFERIAVVTDDAAIAGAFRLFGPLMPGQARVFANAQKQEAAAWISAA